MVNGLKLRGTMLSEESRGLPPQDDKRLFWLTILVAVVLVLTLAAVTYAIWPRIDGELKPLQPGEDLFIMWVPIAILQWSFTGAMVSVLYRLAYRKRIHAVDLELYTQVVAKPFIGLFMGACVYFLALAGVKLLAQAPLPTANGLPTQPLLLRDALWLNVIAFVGGFSDELSITRFVRGRLGVRERDEEGRSSPKPPG
jgi:hypothetical protein